MSRQAFSSGPDICIRLSEPAAPTAAADDVLAAVVLARRLVIQWRMGTGKEQAAQDDNMVRVAFGDALPRVEGIVASDTCDSLALELGVDEVGARRHA